MRWLLVGSMCVAVTACGLDPALTCGDTCADGSVTDGGADVTIAPDAASDGGGGGGDSSIPDAKSDSSGDAGCKAEGGYCQAASQCCSNACSEQKRCVSSCTPHDGSCTQQSCCVGDFCSDGGTCVQCLSFGNPCTDDWQCCGGSCSGGFDGGQPTCHSN